MSSLSRGADDRPASSEVTEGVRDGAGAGQGDSADVFVARQPIFDPSQRVFGYELLFRSGFVNACDATHPTDATARVMDSTMSVFGFDRITLGGHAFVNVTRDVLVNGSVLIMPSDRTVLELLETVAPDEDVVTACRKLKALGYRLALDDFVEDDRRRCFVELADMIKVDVLATPPAEQRALVQRLGRPGLAFVAEKVETPEAFRCALEAGYQYFQGYFFCRPVIVSAREVPSVKVHYLRLLAELHRPVRTLWQLEEIIKRDVGLSYKLVRYVNSAFAMRARRIESLMEALLLVGEDKLRAWASIVALSSMGGDKPAELAALAVTRGKLCELLATASSVTTNAAEAFLVGLFSLLDAIVGRPLPEILSGLGLSAEVTDTVLGGETPLRMIYDLAVAQERADWDVLDARASALGIPGAKSSALYREAIAWAHTTCAQVT